MTEQDKKIADLELQIEFYKNEINKCNKANMELTEQLRIGSVMRPLKTFDIHECITEICKSTNRISFWIADSRKDKSYRYNVKKAIDKMLYSN